MKTTYLSGVGSLGLVVCCQLLATTSFGALGFVSDRTAVTPNQTIDWSDFGLEYDILGSPFSGDTSAGHGFTASLPDIGAEFSLLDQSSGWEGNFAAGERVLTTDFYSGPITLEFDDPIQGIAFQIQSDLYDDFTGIIEAFDTLGSSLGFFAFAGVSTDAGDDSAITIGVLSDIADIGSIAVNVETGLLEAFAINHASVLAPITTPVPEAGTIGGAAVLGALALYGARRAGKRQENA